MAVAGLEKNSWVSEYDFKLQQFSSSFKFSFETKFIFYHPLCYFNICSSTGLLIWRHIAEEVESPCGKLQSKGSSVSDRLFTNKSGHRYNDQILAPFRACQGLYLQ